MCYQSTPSFKSDKLWSIRCTQSISKKIWTFWSLVVIDWTLIEPEYYKSEINLAYLLKSTSQSQRLLCACLNIQFIRSSNWFKLPAFIINLLCLSLGRQSNLVKTGESCWIILIMYSIPRSLYELQWLVHPGLVKLMWLRKWVMFLKLVICPE